MNKATVWACKEQVVRNGVSAAAMDYSPAELYGELRFITRTDMPMHSGSTIRAVWEDDVAKFVEEYDENTDFIITTGQPTAIFAMGHALGRANKTPRFLVWRREDNCYRVLDSLQAA